MEDWDWEIERGSCAEKPVEEEQATSDRQTRLDWVEETLTLLEILKLHYSTPYR